VTLEVHPKAFTDHVLAERCKQELQEKLDECFGDEVGEEDPVVYCNYDLTSRPYWMLETLDVVLVDD